MKININQELKNIDGTTVKPAVLLKSICIQALLANDPKSTKEDLLKRWILATSIQNSKDDIFDLTTDQIVSIKDMCYIAYKDKTIIYSQTVLMLENIKEDEQNDK